MSKYRPLSERLRGHPHDEWKASFSDIEEVLGFPLPKGARNGKSWWSDGEKPHAKAWAGEGWQADVNAGEGLVTFRRGDISPVALDAAGGLKPAGEIGDAGLDMPDTPAAPYATSDAMPQGQLASSSERADKPSPGRALAEQAGFLKARAEAAFRRIQPPKNLSVIAMVAGGVAVVAGLTALLARGKGRRS